MYNLTKPISCAILILRKFAHNVDVNQFPTYLFSIVPNCRNFPLKDFYPDNIVAGDLRIIKNKKLLKNLVMV